jgi:hypothetical protein
VYGFQANTKTEARKNLSNLFHRKCSLNLNITDIEITNYYVYQYELYIYILPLNRIHIKAVIISSDCCKWPSTEITLFFFSNPKLSHVKNTLLQKQQCKFPNFSSRYNNKDTGKGKDQGTVVLVHAMKVHREKCYSSTHS